MTDLPAGSYVGRYRIDGIAGRGGMGVVYRAYQEDLDRHVALKVIADSLATDGDFRARFEREARLSASLDHPNVLPVYETGQQDGALFIAMRLVDGEDLASVVSREGKLEPERAVKFVTQVAGALDAAHARGLVHRDVKPHNVLVSGEHAYLTDFGLTKATSSKGITATGFVLATLDYAPPEQLQGLDTDGRADVYALACMTYHLLAGQTPFDRPSDTARMLAHLNDPPPELPGGPPALSAVIQKGMAKTPEERYPSAGEFARACDAALRGTAEIPAVTGPAFAPTVAQAPGTAAAATAPAAGPAPATVAAAEPEPAAAAAAPGVPFTSTKTYGGSRNKGLLFALPVVLVLVVVGALVLLGGGDDGEKPAAATPTATAAAAEAPRAIASIPVGDAPDGIATGADVVWVTDSKGGKLIRIDAKTGKVAGEPVEAGAAPDSVVAEKGIVYVTSQKDDQLRRFEARPDPVPSGIVEVGRVPEGVSLGKQLVWVALAGDGTVRRIDRASNDLVGGPIGVGGRPIGIHVGDGRVWVANSRDGTVSLIDSATAEPVGEATPVGKDPRDVVEAFGFAWVVVGGDNAVVRLDLKTAKVVGSPITVGEQPGKIAAGEGAIWVTNRGDDTVSQINPKTFQVVGRPLPVGVRPVGIAAGLGGVWVANSGDGTVTRIDPGTPLVDQ